MQSDSIERVEQLVKKGATIPNPQSIMVGDDVDLDRVAGSNVVIYAGCKILGEQTLIMPGVKLGYEGPVTVEDCQIGPNVELKGGFFRGSVFLEKANMGYGAQVREGCILEEEACGAHAVGLKQTILFPFVTLGSLINFCDCFMAGGTSRKNHSEVGSSYIHFNYTPNQDKATPSLIGDVPQGVMLNQPPVFLGGQGGLVGPVRIAYGTVIAAGVVCRRDVLDAGILLLDDERVEREVSFHPGLYWQVAKPVINNTNYIANLIALRRWYLAVRSQFFQANGMTKLLYEGAVQKLDMGIKERIRRFKALSRMMPESAEKYRTIMKEDASEMLLTQKNELYEQWETLESIFAQNHDDPGDPSSREPFLEELDKCISKDDTDYIATIQGLDKAYSAMGTAWLQGIVDRVNSAMLEVLPSFQKK
jgi:UDP-N-acetylglucosamine/UDP-N-acetylgalactosamine diphosphorylase